MLEFHIENDADLTMSCTHVPRDEASRFGIAQTDENNRITDFVEKPKDPPGIPGDRRLFLFFDGRLHFLDRKAGAPRDSKTSNRTPNTISAKISFRAWWTDDDRVFAYPFVDENRSTSVPEDEVYWRDIGTIASYYDANMDLVTVDAAIQPL